MPFPTELMPSWIARFILSEAKAIGVDPWFLAVPTLAAIAGVVGVSRAIQLPTYWFEPCVMWLCLIAPPGGHKSPAFSKVQHHLINLESTLLDEYREQFNEHHKEMLNYKRDVAEHKKGKTDEPPDMPPEAPPRPHVFIEDATIEAVGEALRTNPRGLMLFSDELGGWFSSFCEYKRSGGDVQRWCKLYDGSVLKVTRMSREIRLPRAACSIAGAIQPGVFLRATDDPEKIDSGLIARLSIITPPLSVVRYTKRRPDLEARNMFFAGLARLHALEMVTRDDGSLWPLMIPVTSAAEAIFAEYHDNVAMKVLERTGHITEANTSKVRGLALRCALFCHVGDSIEDPDIFLGGASDPTPIGADTMLRGIQLADALLSHTDRSWAIAADEGGVPSRVRHLWRYLWERRQDPTPPTARDVAMRLRAYRASGGTKAAKIDLELLRGLGAVERETEVVHGRDVVRWRVIQEPKN